jgi:hypothetical protein
MSDMHATDEAGRLERIRHRAYEIWEQEGRPAGRAEAHWDMATEQIAIEDNQRLTTKPVDEGVDTAEPLEAVENQGEFPTLTDQGEEQTAPRRRGSARRRGA